MRPCSQNATSSFFLSRQSLSGVFLDPCFSQPSVATHRFNCSLYTPVCSLPTSRDIPPIKISRLNKILFPSDQVSSLSPPHFFAHHPTTPALVKIATPPTHRAPDKGCSYMGLISKKAFFTPKVCIPTPRLWKNFLPRC